jgi:hypothetical protein
VTGVDPDGWAQIDALTLSGTVGWSSEVHGPAGTVTLARMPKSQVKLRITTGPEGAMVTTWYGGTSATTARKIAVAPGRATAVTVAVPG